MAQLSLLGDGIRPEFPKRASNKVKYDIIVENLKLRGDNEIKWEFPAGIPKYGYRFSGNTIEQLDFVKVSWAWDKAAQESGFGYLYCWDSKVKNETIDQLLKFVDSLPAVKPEHIFLTYVVAATIRSASEIHPLKRNTSGASSWAKIQQGEISLDLESMIPELERRQYESILREGNFWCAYCRKQFPIAQKVVSTIYGRGREDVWDSWKGRYVSKAVVTSTQMSFCSGQCAGNEQMSREG